MKFEELKYFPIEHSWLCVDNVRYKYHVHFFKVKLDGKIKYFNSPTEEVELPFEVKAGIEALGGEKNVTPLQEYNMSGYVVMYHKREKEIVEMY